MRWRTSSIRPPTTASGQWTSFFAGGAVLEPLLGVSVHAMIDDMQTRSGYVAGGSQLSYTPFYAPALPHAPFTGTWGTWDFLPEGGPYAYPPQMDGRAPFHRAFRSSRR
ncbi:MAG: hypothetical protein WDN44_11365 [Sphingomonas sp.]